jgi:hypothetical protein
MDRRKFGAVVAIAAASVMVANGAFADEKKAAEKAKPAAGKVKCAGANSCKGTGACGAADGSHACAGKNECKGKGWTLVGSEADCTKAGGTVVKEAPKAPEKKG